jgi:hypothetical protein
MPRKWQANWPPDSPASEASRDQLVHTLGNLTLLTNKLNIKVSNSGWATKHAALKEHDVLKTNALLTQSAATGWTDDLIRTRGAETIAVILAIWPVPEGHTAGFAKKEQRPRHKIDLATLIGAGLIEPGTVMQPRRKAFSHRTATVLPDGRIDVDGTAYQTPSGAGKAITKQATNGWWFFLVDASSRRSLRDVYHEYVDSTAADVDDTDVPEDDEDDDEDLSD